MNLINLIKKIFTSKCTEVSFSPIKEYDKREAQELLKTEMNSFLELSWTQLSSRIDVEPFHKEIKLCSNKWYQVEINVYWDDKKNENIRVMGSIDDGGFRSFLPQSLDFIIDINGNILE